MKNKKLTIFLFLALMLVAILPSYGDPIVVPLQTKNTIHQVYVGDFHTNRAFCSPSYAEKLKNVLIFDLNHNGCCAVEPKTFEGEKTLEGSQPLLPLFWKKKGTDFVIKTVIDQASLRVELLATKTGLKTPFTQHILDGKLATDRRIIHRIADQICQEITGALGIASTKILYAVKSGKPGGKNPRSEIWETDYDGYNQRQITAESNYCISPRIFPSSGAFTRNRFFYVNYKQGPAKIYSALFSQSKGKPLLSLRGNQLLPAISFQGHLLAFIADVAGRADLFIQPLSAHHGPVGKPIQAYSFPHSIQASPTFSPDGKTIAFVSNQSGSPRIYLLRVPYPKRDKKASLRCLTKKYRENTSPCWSADGTKLAYSAKINGVRQIMIYDFIADEEVQVTHGNRHKENPSFAPNSLHLVFQTVDSSSELFILHLQQRKTVQITKGGSAHYPHWGFHTQT